MYKDDDCFLFWYYQARMNDFYIQKTFKTTLEPEMRYICLSLDNYYAQRLLGLEFRRMQIDVRR